MDLKIVDGVKNRMIATPSKESKSTTETSINYINICFLNYLNYWIKPMAVGGDSVE